MVKNSPTNVGDVRDAVSIPGSGRSPGVGNGNPFQYACLENFTDRGALWATVGGAAKSRTHILHIEPQGSLSIYLPTHLVYLSTFVIVIFHLLVSCGLIYYLD